VKFLEFIKIILRNPVHYNQRSPAGGEFFQLTGIFLISLGSGGAVCAAAPHPALVEKTGFPA
jgi:hypothetical protein